MARSGGVFRSQDQMKVVLIDTQHVVTDMRNFKSVVQSLTSKDSSVSWIEESSFNGAKRKRSPIPNIVQGNDEINRVFACGNIGGDDHISGDNNNGGNNLKLLKGLSFKDLDEMIMEQPSMEEWRQLLAHYNINL